MPHLFGSQEIYKYAIADQKFVTQKNLFENFEKFLSERAKLEYLDKYFNNSRAVISLALAGEKWQVLRTPGHTSDSICLYNPNFGRPKSQGVLISGDTLFSDGIGRTDLESGSPNQMERSLKSLARFRYRLLLPGHGAYEIRKV